MEERKEKPVPFADAAELVQRALRLTFFKPKKEGGRPPIRARWVPGKRPAAPLVVVVGDNASGKSFFRRVVGAICHEAGVEFMPVSMEGRAEGGFARAFVYGAESWESTGAISVRTVHTGVSSSRGRKDHHVIFWDEPDVGLSDAWAAGVGVALAEYARKPPKLAKAAFVVTHSKALVSQLVDLAPHAVIFGERAPETLGAWLEAPVVPRDVAELGAESRRRFLRVQRLVDALGSKRSKR